MPGATSVPGSTARETLARAVQPFRLMPGPPKRGLSRQLEQVPQSSAAAAAAAAAAPTSLGGSAVAVDREDEAPDAAESTREMEGRRAGANRRARSAVRHVPSVKVEVGRHDAKLSRGEHHLY